MNAMSSYFWPRGAEPELDVSTLSGEREAMKDDLELICDVRAGAPAMRARCGRYLPQYAKEDSADYKRRVNSAPWRPEFNDALLSLASKPFSKPVTLAENTPKAIADLAEDIDGRGNNLHTFAREAFLEGLANGVHLILVAFPIRTWGPTLADSNLANPLPYWVHVKIADVIACYTDMKNGREIVTHLRVRENEVVREGFGERIVERVRVLEPGSWELWELQKDVITQKESWVMIDSGDVGIDGDVPDEVFAVLFFTGERTGSIQVKPPLRDIADMQVELYRALSRQDEVLTYAGSPMLAGIGMSQADPKAPTPVVTIGPKSVLLAPEHGDWKYVSPDAACIKEIREQVASVTDELRHLAMQPTVIKSAGVAATTSIVDAAKAHSALQAWALNLKDAIERAFIFTGMWLSESRPTTVNVNTDFAAGDQNYQEANVVLAAEKNSVISKQTARGELQRRSILGPQVDLKNEDALLAEEQQGLDPEQPIDPRNGNVVPMVA
jgi:hypothetical protein